MLRPRHAARTRRRTWLRVRAVLAGGLVLGIGAAVTLASWNDAEYASGTFTTSTFDLQSSLTNVPADFSSHPVGTPLTLGVVTNNMAPSSVAQKQIFFRNTGNIAGTYTLVAPTVTTDDATFPLLAYLNYRAIETTGTCTAASFVAGATYLAGTSTTWSKLTAAAASAPRAIASGGTALGVCIQLQLDPTTPNDRQGKTATVRFVINAVSATP